MVGALGLPYRKTLTALETARIFIHDYAGHAFPVSLSRELAARGHTVVHGFASNLQTPRGALQRQEGDPKTLRFEPLTMDPAYVRDKYSFTKRRGHEVRYGRTVRKFIEEWQPDVVLSGNTPTETQRHLVAACERVDAKFCYWVQDFYSLAVSQLAAKKLPVIGHLVGAWYRHLDRSQLRRSAAVVNITEDFLPQLRQWGIPGDRCHVVPNWAELAAFPLLPKQNAWATEQGHADTFNFVYSGTLGMKHNPELLASLAEQFGGDPTVRVVVNSEGLGSDYLREQKAKRGLHNLILNPFQPFDRMAEVLASADVLITVLEPEAGVFSVPSKTLSYLCAGRAILGAMPPENLAARIVAGEPAGIVVSPRDRTGFLAAAKRLHENTELRQEMGAAGRAYAERTFDIKAITDQFEAIFEGVMK